MYGGDFFLITYNLRKPVDCENSISIGVTGENLTFTQDFFILGLISPLDFSIHIRFSDGSVNSVIPDSVSVDENGTLIKWVVHKNDIFTHGFFELQLEGRNNNELIFQTEIIKMRASESLCIEDKAYENPNSETLRLREEAYNALSEIKLQQDKIDENLKAIWNTDITKKADKATTLNGYGITDAYTKAQSTSLFGLGKTVLFNSDFVPLKISNTNSISSGFATGNTAVTTVFISSAVRTVQAGSFTGCTALTDVYIDNSNTAIQIMAGAFPASVNLHFKDSFNFAEPVLQAILALDSLIKNKADTASLDIKEDTINKINDAGFITDKTKNYPSLNYLDEYYYDYNSIDSMLDEKANKADTLDGYGIKDAMTATQINSALSQKVNSTLIESGSGEFNIPNSSADKVASASFHYQRTGNFVTVTMYINFKSFSINSASTSIALTGLPFVCKNSVNPREPCVTNAKKNMLYAIGINTSHITLLIFEPCSFTATEKLSFTTSYKIA